MVDLMNLTESKVEKIGRKILKTMKVEYSFLPLKTEYNSWGLPSINQNERYALGGSFPRIAANEIVDKLFTEPEKENLANLMTKLKEKDSSLIDKANHEVTRVIDKYKENTVTGKVFDNIPSNALNLLGLIKIEKEHFQESYNFFDQMLNDLNTTHGHKYKKGEVKLVFTRALEKLAEFVDNKKKKDNSDSEQNEQNQKKEENGTPPNPNKNQEEQNKEKEPNSPPPEKNGSENIPKPTNPPSSTDNKDNQNYSLEKAKAAAITEINQVMAQEIKITDQDLPATDRKWKDLINNSNNVEYITNLKEKLLVVIQQIKKEKKDNNKLSELVKKGEGTDKPGELKKIIEQIEKFRGEKTYESLKEKTSVLKKKLADQDIEGYCNINHEMIKRELKDEKVKENELEAEVQKKLEKLRKGGINQGEVEAIKDEVSDSIKLKSAEKKLEKLLKDYPNASPQKQKKILNQIIAFINNSNSFYQKVYEQKRSEVDSLLKKTSDSPQQSLATSKNNDDSSNHVEIIIGGIVIVEIILIVILIIKNIKKSFLDRTSS